MSQYPQPVFEQPMKYPQTPPPQENGWGLAGFVVSIAGLIFCGIPSIVGLVLSAIGLRKEPRGFAIAGVAIGLLGILEIVCFCVFLLTVYRAAESGIGALKGLTIQMQLEHEAELIGNEWENKSRVPTQAEGDDLLAGKRDAIGNSIVYETDGNSFSLRSAGPDGILETDDDTVAGPYHDVKSTRQFDFDDPQWNLDDFKDDLDMEEFDDKLEAMEDALRDAKLE